MKMNNVRYSIIVPVYNVEQYIGQCIESILAQTFDNLELILVDDGSQDGSGRICDSYAEKDQRIKVIHQKNSGVSKARNVGIETATGDYLMFVDGDDWVDPNYLSIVDSHNTGNSDIYMVGIAQDYQDEGGHVLYSDIKGTPIYRHIPQHQLPSEIGYLIKTMNMESSCLKLYRRSFIVSNCIRFLPGMIVFEDFYFVLSCMICSPSVTLIPFIGYHYRVALNYNPAARRGYRDLYPSIHNLFVKFDELMSELYLTGWPLEIVLHTMTDKISVVLAQSCNSYGFKQKTKPFRQIHNDDVLLKYKSDVLRYAGGRYRLMHKMMSVKLYYIAYIIYRYL